MGKIQGPERKATPKVGQSHEIAGTAAKTRKRPAKETTEAALRKLVSTHAKNSRNPVIFAAWYRLDDPRDFYILEIARNVSNPGDAEWINIEFLPPPELRSNPKSRLKLTYMSPEEFHQGVEDPTTSGHKIYRRIMEEGFKVLFERGKSDKRLGSIKKALGE